MMDKKHLPYWARGRVKNKVSQACLKPCSPALRRPAPFPEHCAASQPNSTFLSLPYSLALMPQQLLYFWPHQHCTICLWAHSSCFISVMQHQPEANSAVKKWLCLETADLLRYVWAMSSNRHFYLLGPLLLLYGVGWSWLDTTCPPSCSINSPPQQDREGSK